MRLESITFAANFGFGRKFVKAASIFWPCVLVCLQQICTDHIRSVHFECQLEDVVEFALAQVDELLSQPAFSHLKDITFAFADTGLLEDLDQNICQALPRTASRGILRRVSLHTCDYF